MYNKSDRKVLTFLSFLLYNIKWVDGVQTSFRGFVGRTDNPSLHFWDCKLITERR